MKTITHTQAQQIVDIACQKEKEDLFELWGKKIILRQEVEISDNQYQEMRKAYTSEQNELFDEIFGKDVKFKVGDWIVPLYPKERHEGHGRNNRAYKIYKIDNLGVRTYNDLGEIDGNGYIEFKNLRLATKEEIQKTKYIPEGTPCLARDSNTDTWKLVYSNGDGRFKGGTNNFPWLQVQVLDINNLPKYYKID